MSEFVPLRIAKKLKEKGFPQGNKDDITEKYYTISDSLKAAIMAANGEDVKWYCPTISQVLKWLREEKRLYLGINYMPQIMECSDYYFPTIQYIGELKPVVYTKFTDIFKTYEECAFAGIEYVLDNLI